MADIGVTRTAILLPHAPPALDERRFSGIDWRALMVAAHGVRTLGMRPQPFAAMHLERGSSLSVHSLRAILGVTGGVTSRAFKMVKALAKDAIETGQERITDKAVQTWQPSWAKHSWSIRREPVPVF
ncbi:hypothetical protein [Ruegeria arenilitoris]|uniref:hypothetical protein n=1 Tax=Ruegeria arenilitoris TaxID=1173585 RepID=UPI00147F6A41|nr:hypothetical protein [Ruegeria arenilitoris]